MKYYYTDANGQVLGPVTKEELQTLSVSGALGATAQVCEEGTQQWVAASQVIRPVPQANGPVVRASAPTAAPRPTSMPPLPANPPLGNGLPEISANRYPALGSISIVSKICGFIIGALSCFAFIQFVVGMVNQDRKDWSILAGGVLGVVVCIALVAFGELIHVFIDIEENTRKKA